MAGIGIDLDRDVEYGIPARIEDPVTGEWKRGRRPPGGVVMRVDPQTKAEVWMYKNAPGIFYSRHGSEVSQTMAERAGFNVKLLLKRREIIGKRADFEAKQLAEAGMAIREVVKSRNGYNLVRLIDDTYVVETEDGEIMTRTKHANSLEMGMGWLSDFAGPEKEEVAHPSDPPAVTAVKKK